MRLLEEPMQERGMRLLDDEPQEPRGSLRLVKDASQQRGMRLLVLEEEQPEPRGMRLIEDTPASVSGMRLIEEEPGFFEKAYQNTLKPVLDYFGQNEEDVREIWGGCPRRYPRSTKRKYYGFDKWAADVVTIE